jgi:hypothetical protein
VSEDPLFRKIADAFADAFGEPRQESVCSEVVARTDGRCFAPKGYKVFINDEPISAPTDYSAGDRLRTELIQ